LPLMLKFIGIFLKCPIIIDTKAKISSGILFHDKI